DFLTIEARDELGGRMRSTSERNRHIVELGANWIRGVQEGSGPANPILVLARKHNISVVEIDHYESVS
ncbi:hypothetical protein BC826DRAFT_889756, partial [Russula brevipes]